MDKIKPTFFDAENTVIYPIQDFCCGNEEFTIEVYEVCKTENTKNAYFFSNVPIKDSTLQAYHCNNQSFVV